MICSIKVLIIRVLSARVRVRFAEGVAKAGIPFSRTTQWKLSGSLEHFRVRFDQQERKYATYEFIVRMLDTIFDAIEKSGLYEVDSRAEDSELH